MLFNEPKNQEKPQRFLILVIILSMLFGGVAGGGATFLIFNNLGSFNNLVGQKNSQAVISNANVSQSDFDAATIDVVKKTSPSVVSIIISKKVKDLYSANSGIAPDLNNFFEFGWPFNYRLQQPELSPEEAEKKQEIGGGSGFIVSEDGLILTNKHVVIDDLAEFEVVTYDNQKYPAKVLAKDPINDLAVLKIDAKDLKPLTLGDSDKIEIGQTVIAIGNSLSEFRNTVTRGVVSGINRRVEAGGAGISEVLEEAIQTDAAINPGNSGGPLLNLAGEVIGINTAISQSGQLIGFAIPINGAKQVIESIKETGKIVRPFLGVRYIILNKQIAEANKIAVDYGALIVKGAKPEDLAVVPGSPADKAGLVENDIILELNGEKVDDNHSLARMLAKSEPGQEVELKIWHKGEEKTVKVKLEERKD
jgi:serine protease Do